jgi:hypothetical protein
MKTPQTTHDSPGRNDSEDDDLYLDTIALLQDEISRLESELQARRDDDLETRISAEPAGDAAAAESLQQDLDRARFELSARDETINVLLEQLRLIEDAESASRAEWEQLARWVSEVEERVEGQDLSTSRQDEEERENLRRGALELRGQLDLERKQWAAERRRLEGETGRLQELLARAATVARAATADGSGNAGAAAALEALESENRRLRESYLHLEQTSQAETEKLRARAEATHAEHATLRKDFEHLQHENIRQSREHETAMASQRAAHSRATLAASEATHVAPLRKDDADKPDSLEVDMRIRAFRQHLKEIHHHEAETRNHNRLSARLSRLWSRTAPK